MLNFLQLKARSYLPFLRPRLHSLLGFYCIYSVSAFAQAPSEKYQNLMLYSPFGEFCTMCEAVLHCQVDAETESHNRSSDASKASYSLYHIQARGFWAQIGTIWEWTEQMLYGNPMSGHERPVVRYEIKEGVWQEPISENMLLQVEPPSMDFGREKNHSIDRLSGQWLKQGRAYGLCQRLELWPALAAIEQRSNAKIAEAGSKMTSINSSQSEGRVEN